MEKKLYRSRNKRWLSGVCGGLASYFNLDPIIIRILALLALCLCTLGTLVAYIIMALVIPLEPEKSPASVGDR
ncbi:MAG TPA: PspC domain-containing protein [Dehalococcoidales bacterium]|nr:PspC domain-containing protein [Dehalococcoidales bacterium]